MNLNFNLNLQSPGYKNIVKIIIAAIAFLLLIILIFIYLNRPVLTLIAKFDKLPPVSKKLNIYYKGYKVGKTSKILLSEDSKYTLLYLDIYKKGLQLPENVFAKIKIQEDKNKNDYIEIIINYNTILLTFLEKLV